MHVKARILRDGQWSALTEATFSTPVVSSDFDEDGDVDGNDFLVWQCGLGTIGNAVTADGDADGDQDVDAIDLMHWVTQFGTCSTSGPVSASKATSVAFTLTSFEINHTTPLRQRFAIPTNVGSTLSTLDLQLRSFEVQKNFEELI